MKVGEDNPKPLGFNNGKKDVLANLGKNDAKGSRNVQTGTPLFSNHYSYKKIRSQSCANEFGFKSYLGSQILFLASKGIF